MAEDWGILESVSLLALKICLDDNRHVLEYYGTQTARRKRCFTLVQHPSIGHDNGPYLTPTWDKAR